MSVWPYLADCVRDGCGHSSDMHRHDDSTDDDKFRCLGYDPMTDPVPKTPDKRACNCPDMVRSAENLTALRPG